MSVSSVLIVGCGDIGSRVARLLIACQYRVYGVRRTLSDLPEGVLGVAADVSTAALPTTWPQEPLDYVVYCVAASQHDEAGYRAAYVEGVRNTLAWLQASGQHPKRLFFVSSSGVYGQQSGEWVDEQSPTEPSSYTGQLMLEAERLAQGSEIPATVVRLTGIYGPGRERMIEQVKKGCQAAAGGSVYGNRIHADDAAGLLAFLIQADATGAALEPCYIGVDDCPATLAELIDWLRGYLQISHTSDQAAMRRTGSKRCSNARARALGWAPQYPSFREGYAALLNGRG
ncbi:SDR family oxidoreductase [Pseudomonas sp. nanlin1]|uniref:SDR family oxidoreductase n=1 Tax=Pseudomonas sp. nanlin1 TaxID=3040605 RepID=UPI00388EF4EA